MSPTVLSRLLMALLAFAVGAVALAAEGERGGAADAEAGASAPDVQLLAARGPIGIRNSRAGRAIVKARNMRPGSSRFGTVRVGVSGGSARVRLALHRLSSPVGPHGGVLADSLVVKIRRLTGHRRLLFMGHPGEMRTLRLGHWRQGRSHRFRLRVRFPGAGLKQNQFEGSRASFALVWSGVAARS